MSLYEIAFSGQLVPGADSEQVRTNLARLFQADAQRIAALFSGRRIVIKNGLDASTAEKYRLAMERAGARAEVVEMAVEVEEVELAPPPPVEPAPAARPRRLQVAPRDEYMAAFSEVDAPDFGLAPLGADLQDARPEPVAPRVDLTQFSLAPVGSDMGQAKALPAAPPPDTSHLRLQD
ncbi:hypothetical protein [Zestomonas thermotolerans]|uniref:hypothetical protein n=1 Tax=Zestomonas thermotolerans TaxID=157784 RepID=UPI0003797E12|nr:hypothetical protein [Pseudomonas thermotolerans]